MNAAGRTKVFRDQLSTLFLTLGKVQFAKTIDTIEETP